MKLSDLFTRGVVSVGPDATLATVASKMQGHNVGAVVVEENKRPVGIITDRDLALAMGSNGVNRHSPVVTVMSRHVLAIPDDTGIFAVTRFMRERHVRRLPIVDSADHIVGMVTLDDLLLYLGREFFNLAEGIRTEMDVRPATGSEDPTVETPIHCKVGIE